MIKYEITNQLTGTPAQVPSFEEIKTLKDTFIKQYVEQLVEPLFTISVLIQNEDGSWTQALADDNGEPIIFDDGIDYSIPSDKIAVIGSWNE